MPDLADVLEPIMLLLNAIPRVILAPLFVIWLGIEISSKIALAVVLVAVLIFFAVYNGIKDVNQLFVDRVRTLVEALFKLNDPSGYDAYERNVQPFVKPLQALGIQSTMSGGSQDFRLIITIAKP